MTNYTAIDVNILSPDQIVDLHSKFGKPSIILTFITTMLFSLLFGMIYFDTDAGRKKFFLAWATTLIIVGIIIIFYIISPFMMQDLSNFINSLVS